MRIIIDGYNLLNTTYFGLSAIDVDSRDVLIGDLAKYKRSKGADIIIVFDNREGYSMSGNRFKDKGINIVFTPRGKSADDLICEMIKLEAEGIIVVTSDREIKDRVERCGAVCFSSEFFSKRCQDAAFAELKGAREDDIMYKEKPKKGPSRRKSKKDRKRDRVAPKL